MTHNIYLYIFIMAAVTFAVRVLPMTLIRRQIKSRFLRSFLYYVPYVTLSVMTFPAIINATQSPISGILALAAGIIAAWLGAGLFPVALTCCAVVFVTELIPPLL
ncbi:MAG: AzlD domain-containing protein [Clostridiales bacterium]|nr:AzlD domain-containing protein [Clostridiales bacterium]